MPKEAFIIDLGTEIYGPQPDIRKLGGLSRRLKKFGCEVISKSYPETGKKAAFVTGLDKLPRNWMAILRESKKIVAPVTDEVPAKKTIQTIKEPTNFLERLALVLDRTLLKKEELEGELKLLWEENATLTREKGNLQETISKLLEENQRLRNFKEAVAVEVPEVSERVSKAMAVEGD